LAEQDNTSGGANTNRMSYTAGGQLYFSYVWSGVNLPKRYNYTWNWYDGEGRRIIAHSRNGTGDVTAATAPDSGIRTFYVYDGSDVALAIVNGSPGTWAIRQRYLNGGLDHQLAMRTRQGATGYPKTLALISDYQGSLIGAFNTSGVIDPQVVNFKADPFGTVTQAFDQYDGPVNPEVGYTGAATTNSTAGFVYLRNRWYDPQTGRFLTQDPIGLAGGVNLYAYAGNNPIAFGDPFGLCPHSPCKDPPPAPARNGPSISELSQQEEFLRRNAVLLAIAPFLGGVLEAAEESAGNIESQAEEGIAPKAGVGATQPQSRYIPASVADAALAENPTRTCPFCKMPGTATTLDHAWPFAKGGSSTDILNIQLACPHCNASKGIGLYPKTPPPSYVGPWPPHF
jgi:RHS repeat-associated protein